MAKMCKCGRTEGTCHHHIPDPLAGKKLPPPPPKPVTELKQSVAKASLNLFEEP